MRFVFNTCPEPQLSQSFLAFLAKFGRKHPQIKQLPWKPNKTEINSTSFLPLIDSPNDLPKLKVVESTVY